VGNNPIIQWSVVDGDQSTIAANNLLSKPRDTTLVIKPSVLTPGKTYTFRFSVTDSNGLGFAQTTTTVNEPPKFGIVTATSKTNQAFSTYTLSTSGWVPNVLPLTYYFALVNGGQEIRLTKESTLSTTEIVMPQPTSSDGNVEIIARAVDTFGSVGEVRLSVNVGVVASTPEQGKQVVSNLLSTYGDSTDSEKLTQVAAAISDLLPPIPKTTVCSTSVDCSSAGTCVSGVCKCNSGFLGSDCSITDAELSSRLAARQQLFNALINSYSSAIGGRRIEQSTTLSLQTIQQQLSGLSYVINDYQQVTAAMIQPTLDILTRFLTSVVQIDDGSLSTILQILTTLMDSMYLVSKANVNLSIATQVRTATIPQFSAKALLNKVVKETASTFSQASISVAVQLTTLDSITTPTTYSIGDGSAASVSTTSGSTSNVNIGVSRYAYNMYDTSTIIPSAILSVTATSSALPPYSVLLDLHGDYSSQNNGSISCVKWNGASWDADACTIASMTSVLVTCKCSSTGDYAVQQRTPGTTQSALLKDVVAGSIAAVVGAIVGAIALVLVCLFIIIIIAACIILKRRVKHPAKKEIPSKLTRYEVRRDSSPNVSPQKLGTTPQSKQESPSRDYFEMEFIIPPASTRPPPRGKGSEPSTPTSPSQGLPVFYGAPTDHPYNIPVASAPYYDQSFYPQQPVLYTSPTTPRNLSSPTSEPNQTYRIYDPNATRQ
jgi:hypothetical protein